MEKSMNRYFASLHEKEALQDLKWLTLPTPP